MNFLSHFYFDRYTEDPDLILGTVLPDLLKNADKRWIMHPEKKKELFTHDKKLMSLLEGWNRHLLVDKYFHASDFFCEQTKIIRSAIVPLLEGSPVRPSFLSHIGLELMLDSLLITEGLIVPDDLYNQLELAERESCREFIVINGISEPKFFFQFFDKFLHSAYLNNYVDPQHIVYALNRICMRVWDDPLNKTQQNSLTDVIVKCRSELRTSFISIFNDIDKQLKK